MNHVTDILKLAKQAISEQVDAVLATVVHTEGSAYRKAGAMMLICADGRSVGMISGGCLEPHIIKKAFWLTRNGPIVQIYQTGEGDYSIEHNGEQEGLFDENLNNSNDQFDNDLENNDNDNDYDNDMDIELNFGLGCNGRVHVLFERLSSAMRLIKCIEDVRCTEQPQTVATLIRSEDPSHPVGLHVNLDEFSATPEISVLNAPSTDILVNPILRKAITLLSIKEQSTKELSATERSNKQAEFVSIKGVFDNDLDTIIQTQWLVRRLQPQIKLLICGAGNDVIPLVTLAKMQDWHVTVVDSRSHYATRSRFIHADKVMCLPLEDSETLLKLSKNAAVAIMSHSLTQDRSRLKVLLANPPIYLGQLGPKYRTERLIDEIKALYAEDAQFSEVNTRLLQQGINQLHYPIGYKMGGEGPEALALGVIAQINAVMHGTEFIEKKNNLNVDSSSKLNSERGYLSLPYRDSNTTSPIVTS